MYNAQSAQASRRGRANRDEGAIFERIISASCEYYRTAGFADIEKTPEPFRITRQLEQGKFIGHFAKKAQPDFQGCIKGGQSIVFDAKATSTDKIPTSALTDVQREILLRRDLLGAISGVLMCYGFKAFAFVPIQTFLNAKKLNGHQHWTADEACQYGSKVEYKGGRLRILNILSERREANDETYI